MKKLFNTIDVTFTHEGKLPDSEEEQFKNFNGVYDRSDFTDIDWKAHLALFTKGISLVYLNEDKPGVLFHDVRLSQVAISIIDFIEGCQICRAKEKAILPMEIFKKHYPAEYLQLKATNKINW